MAEYVNKDEAIRILTEIMEKRKKACGRGPIYEAAGLNYAISILKQLPVKEIEE